MTNEMPSDVMVAYVGTFVLFAACAILRLFLMKRIVQSTGGHWDLNKPFSNVREERQALQSLPKGKLRSQLRLVTVVGVGSWAIGLGLFLTHTHLK